MRTILYSLIVLLFAIPTTWACMPEDGERAAEIAFSNQEVFDITKLIALGKEDVNYRIENPEDENPVVVYRSHFDEQAMVKVGYSPSGYEWHSVLIVLPEGMDPEAFDFVLAMQEELKWLVQLGVITGLDEGQIPAITRDLIRGARFFTGEMILSTQNCFAPDQCVRCTGAAAYTKLPPESLVMETAIEEGVWGRIKAFFQ